jgi:hypothetical protein
MRRVLALIAATLTLVPASASPELEPRTFAPTPVVVALPAQTRVARVGAASPLAVPAATAKTGVTKVLVIVEENHSVAQARKGMPYLTALGRRYGVASRYRGTRHPSEPNYLAMAGGSTFGVADDRPPSAHRIHGRSVFGQAAARHLTSGTYSESMPTGTCVLRGNYHRGYAVKHNPQAFFVDERQGCRRTNRSGYTFWADAAANRLPTVGFLIPNKCHDGHDCSLRTADQYLKTFLSPVLRSRDFTSGRLAVVITADEDNGRGVNDVYTAVLQAGLHHKTTEAHLTHYSLSRLLSEVTGSKPLRKARQAPDLAKAFGLRLARRP